MALKTFDPTGYVIFDLLSHYNGPLLLLCSHLLLSLGSFTYISKITWATYHVYEMSGHVYTLH